MRIYLRNTLFLTLTIFLECCFGGSKERHDQIVLNKPNGEKAIFSILIKGGDTVYDGVAKFYHSNGKISDENFYKQNRKEGLQLHFDSSGRLISKIMYEGGLANGAGVLFDANGNIEKENAYVNGRLFFTKWYYPNGNVRVYSALNDSLPFYIIKFDSLGRKESENGYAFALSEDCFIGNIDSVHVGEPIKAIIPVAAIPGYSIGMKSARFDSSGEMVGSSDSIPVFGHYALFQATFDKLGKYRVGIAGELCDEKGKVIRRDTLGVYIDVVK